METVCLDFFLLAAGSWSLVSDCALSKQRGIAPQPVWTARGAESSEGRFSRFPRTWQINSYSDWNTLSFNWSLGHLNFCLFFFSEMNLTSRNTCRQKWKTGKKTYFPWLLLWRRGWWEEKKQKQSKLRKACQRLALSPRSAVIAGLTPSRGSLWVRGVFPAWLRGHPLTVHSHPSPPPNWISHRGCGSLHVSSAHEAAQVCHTSRLLSAEARDAARYGGHEPAPHAPLLRFEFDTNVCHMTRRLENKQKENQHFQHLNEPKTNKKKLIPEICSRAETQQKWRLQNQGCTFHSGNRLVSQAFRGIKK